MTSQRQLRDEGQALSLAPLTEQTRRDFLRIIDNLPKWQAVSTNDLRDWFDTAQIRGRSRGALFADAVKLGLLEPLRTQIDGYGWADLTVPSTGPRSHHSRVQVYERTGVAWEPDGQVAA